MMGMTEQETRRAVAMWGIAMCLFAAAAGWVTMRFGMVWSIADLPTSENMNWIVPAYIIAEVAVIPLSAKLMDIYGSRRILPIGPLLFIGGSMLCVLSVSVEMLILCRFIQGLGGGFILGMAFTVVGRYYEPTMRGKCHELMTAAFAFGSLFGSAVGYFLTTNFNWRFSFIVLSLVVYIGLMMAWRLLPEDEGSNDSPDVVGMILAVAMFGVATLYTQMANVFFDLISIQSVVFVAVIIVLVYALIKHIKVYYSPIIPFGTSAFEKKLVVLMFMFSLCGLGLIQYFFKLYLTYYEFDIYKASAMFIFLIAGAAGPSMLGCRYVFKTGIRPWVTIGAILVAISLVVVHFIADQGEVQLGISLFVFGFGLGCIVTEILCSLQCVVDRKDIGKHTGNLMTIRMIGILVGNAFVGSYIKEVVNRGRVPMSIDLNTTKDVLIQIGVDLLQNLQNAAQSLDNGLMSTVLIMAVASVILAYIAFKVGKKDLEELEKE